MTDTTKKFPKSEGLEVIMNTLENILTFNRLYKDQNDELVRVYDIENEIFIHVANSYWFASELPF